MTRRLAALVAALAMASACRSPTAPEVVPVCSLIVTSFNPVTRVCYTPCPPGAEAVAQEYSFGYSPTDLCSAGATP